MITRKIQITLYGNICLSPTHDGLFAKEDVDDSNVLLPRIVEVLLDVLGGSQHQKKLTVFFLTSRSSLCLLLIGLGSDDMYDGFGSTDPL